MLRLMLRSIESIQKISIFVSSFSEHKDMLSQWRGYCPRGNGFSLGFDSHLLKSVFENQSFRFLPCIYDDSEQRGLVAEIIINLLQSFKIELKGGANIKVALQKGDNEFRSKLISVAPIIKHYSFAEEKEWRAVSFPIAFSHPQVNFREGISTLTPYFVLMFNGNNPLREIVIGPTPHTELASNSVVAFCIKNNVKFSSISASIIPFRGW